MQGLQVELIDGLRRDERHSGTLDRLGDRLCITKVVLLSLRLAPYIPRRHQPRIVAKRLQLATEMMRTDASLHANQTRWHIGQTGLYLATRPLLAQHNAAAHIQTDDVARVLADIDTDYGDRAVESVGHGGAPCLWRPLPDSWLAGQEHGRTIPLADIHRRPHFQCYFDPIQCVVLTWGANETARVHYICRWHRSLVV